MNLLNCSDKEFKRYGFVVNSYDFTDLLKALDNTPCPKDSVVYSPEDSSLQNQPVSAQIQSNLFGGMPIQLGYCNGHSISLNCFEYHRGSELVVAGTPLILLLADLRDVDETGTLDTAKTEAFYVPSGSAVVLYETTLHYAPTTAKNCDCDHFRAVICLIKGTNVGKPEINQVNAEDRMLWATNKWLLAHPDTGEAKQGAYIGLVGENITL